MKDELCINFPFCYEVSHSIKGVKCMCRNWEHLRKKKKINSQLNFYVLLTMHLSIISDNYKLDAHLLYFTIHLLQSSTCFEHYMLIIRRLNFIDASSGIVTLSRWPSGAQVGRILSQPVPLSGRLVHRFGENSPNLCTGRPLTERTMPDAASIQFNLLMMSI